MQIQFSWINLKLTEKKQAIPFKLQRGILRIKQYSEINRIQVKIPIEANKFSTHLNESLN